MPQAPAGFQPFNPQIAGFSDFQDPAPGWLSTYSTKYGIPLELARRMMLQESGGNQRAVSVAGARGRFQITPETAKALGINPDDPEQNIEGGMRYLRQKWDEFHNWAMALAAYNAGSARVKSGEWMKIHETVGYVRSILGDTRFPSPGEVQVPPPKPLETAGPPEPPVPDTLDPHIAHLAGQDNVLNIHYTVKARAYQSIDLVPSQPKQRALLIDILRTAGYRVYSDDRYDHIHVELSDTMKAVSKVMTDAGSLAAMGNVALARTEAAGLQVFDRATLAEYQMTHGRILRGIGNMLIGLPFDMVNVPFQAAGGVFEGAVTRGLGYPAFLKALGVPDKAIPLMVKGISLIEPQNIPMMWGAVKLLINGGKFTLAVAEAFSKDGDLTRFLTGPLTGGAEMMGEIPHGPSVDQAAATFAEKVQSAKAPSAGEIPILSRSDAATVLSDPDKARLLTKPAPAGFVAFETTTGNILTPKAPPPRGTTVLMGPGGARTAGGVVLPGGTAGDLLRSGQEAGQAAEETSGAVHATARAEAMAPEQEPQSLGRGISYSLSRVGRGEKGRFQRQPGMGGKVVEAPGAPRGRVLDPRLAEPDPPLPEIRGGGGTTDTPAPQEKPNLEVRAEELNKSLYEQVRDEAQARAQRDATESEIKAEQGDDSPDQHQDQSFRELDAKLRQRVLRKKGVGLFRSYAFVYNRARGLGKAGVELAGNLWRMQTGINRVENDLRNSVRSAMVNGRRVNLESRPWRINEEEANRINDALAGHLDPVGLSQKERAHYEVWNDWLNNRVPALMEGTGLHTYDAALRGPVGPWTPARGYSLQMIDWDKVEQLRGDMSAAGRARYGDVTRALQKAFGGVNEEKAWELVKRWRNLNYEFPEGFQYRRGNVDLPRQILMDPRRAFRIHVMGVGRKAVQARVFGAANEKAEDALKAIADQYGYGAAQKLHAELLRIFKIEQPFPGSMDAADLRNNFLGMTYFITANPRWMAAHLPQIGNTLSKAGVWNTTKALFERFSMLLSAEGRQALGTIYRDIRNADVQTMYEDTPTQGWQRAAFTLRTAGLPRLYRFLKGVSAIAGRHYATDLFKAYVGEAGTVRIAGNWIARMTPTRIEEEFMQAGIDVKHMKQLYAQSKQVQQVPGAAQKIAQQLNDMLAAKGSQVADDAFFERNPIRTANWAESPWGRVTLGLKQFALRQLQFGWQTLAETARHGDAAAFVKFLAITQGQGEAKRIMYDAINAGVASIVKKIRRGEWRYWENFELERRKHPNDPTLRAVDNFLAANGGFFIYAAARWAAHDFKGVEVGIAEPFAPALDEMGLRFLYDEVGKAHSFWESVMQGTPRWNKVLEPIERDLLPFGGEMVPSPPLHPRRLPGMPHAPRP